MKLRKRIEIMGAAMVMSLSMMCTGASASTTSECKFFSDGIYSDAIYSFDDYHTSNYKYHAYNLVTYHSNVSRRVISEATFLKQYGQEIQGAQQYSTTLKSGDILPAETTVYSSAAYRVRYRTKVHYTTSSSSNLVDDDQQYIYI